MSLFKKLLMVVIMIHILILFFKTKEEDGQGNMQNTANQEGQVKDPSGENGQSDETEDFEKFTEQEKKKSETKLTIVFEEPGEEKEEASEDKKQEDSFECPGSFYYGVGVTMFFDYVDEVAPGSPAEAGGMISGDRVIGFYDHKAPKVFVNGTNFKGTEGEGLDVVVHRDGKTLTLTMVRGKICYQPKTKGN